MALHCRENRDDFVWFQWWVGQMMYPPFIEGTIGVNVEALFWRRCFGKGVGYVGTIYEEILCGCNSVEHTRACLIDAVCVCFVKNMGLPRMEQAVADHPGLLAIIKSLDAIGPYSVEHGCVFIH